MAVPQQPPDPIRDRAAQLGMSLAELARRIDITEATIQAVRENNPDRGHQPTTIAKIEQALRWAPGSILSVRMGGHPVELSSTGSQTTQDASHSTTTWGEPMNLAPLTIEELLALRDRVNADIAQELKRRTDGDQAP